MPISRDAGAALLQRHGQRVEQLGRGEHAADVVPGREDRDGLVDAVLLVRFQVLHPALLDQLDDPARIQVDAEADAAAILRQVFHRQPQSRAVPTGPASASSTLVGKYLSGSVSLNSS